MSEGPGAEGERGAPGASGVVASAVRGLVAPLAAFAVGALAPSMWRVHPEGVALTVCLLLLGGLQLPVWRRAPAVAAGLVGPLLWTVLAAHERTATVVLPIVAASLVVSALAGVWAQRVEAPLASPWPAAAGALACGLLVAWFLVAGERAIEGEPATEGEPAPGGERASEGRVLRTFVVTEERLSWREALDGYDLLVRSDGFTRLEGDFGLREEPGGLWFALAAPGAASAIATRCSTLVWPGLPVRVRESDDSVFVEWPPHRDAPPVEGCEFDRRTLRFLAPRARVSEPALEAPGRRWGLLAGGSFGLAVLALAGLTRRRARALRDPASPAAPYRSDLVAHARGAGDRERALADLGIRVRALELLALLGTAWIALSSPAFPTTSEAPPEAGPLAPAEIAPTSALLIETPGTWARVTGPDGTEWGLTPIRRATPAGRATVELRFEGQARGEGSVVSVDVPPGGTAAITAAQPPPAPTAPPEPGAAPRPATGTLVIVTPGTWANVYGPGGELWGATPMRRNVPAGELAVELQMEGRAPGRHVSVVVPGGGTARIVEPR